MVFKFDLVFFDWMNMNVRVYKTLDRILWKVSNKNKFTFPIINKGIKFPLRCFHTLESYKREIITIKLFAFGHKTIMWSCIVVENILIIII